MFCGKKIRFWQRKSKYIISDPETNETIKKGFVHKKCLDIAENTILKTAPENLSYGHEDEFKEKWNK